MTAASDGTRPVDAVTARVKAVYGGWRRSTPVARMRADWDGLFGHTPAGVAVEPVAVGPLAAEWMRAPGTRRDRAVLYLHGGGFQVGSPLSHRELMAAISAAAGCAVLGLAYRLAPEHRFPAALEDAVAAYGWLRAAGFAPGRLAFAGDSAGGGLALSTLLALRGKGQALPAAAALLSVWTDLTASGESYRTRSAADPIHQRPMIQAMAAQYLGEDGDPMDPLASPLFADPRGLPPLLLQVGDRETVLSDSVAFAERAQAAGVAAELQVYPDMIHVFQQFPRDLPEARAAIAAIGDFLAAHFDKDED
ncbi:alpha/beta hydrolase [Zavarzinia compransoris]|uniref:Alpha/beta hydrolase n=1 Tax=Zavarzinia compransoris TaxID=1264899 RepID=A0A317E5V4_9PROT|nr:alpha/beta hydrolase [Zavarzinia compransoris]PWR21992.1 alpha/beta hydrolase [Zavarzinia compransoris]TDP47269.1 acetyl esterase/lipase [Zavarzinia compransoris]